VDQLTERAQELTLSRQRLVDAHDDARRRLERDIHDGAQQHLVALTVNLRLAETIEASAPERAREVLAEQAAAADDAIGTLVDLSRGIYPSTLTEDGVGPALRMAAAASPVPVEVTDELGSLRANPDVEVAVYFCCLEAGQNAAKHSRATTIRVSLTADEATLTFRVVDDGRGFALDAHASGTGLQNMRARIEAVGGQLTVESQPGQGTEVCGQVPLTADAGTAR
jgi:signal transduction histidine kinase